MNAIKWMLENQIGRRNLNDFCRAEIVLRNKDLINEIAEKAKENLSLGGQAFSPKEGLNNCSKVAEPINHRKIMADMSHTSERNIQGRNMYDRILSFTSKQVFCFTIYWYIMLYYIRMRDEIMNCIGIRVKPTEIYFTVLTTSRDDVEIKTTEKIKIPISMDVPDQLSYIRTTLFSIINEYKIANAGIRRMEDNSPSNKLEPIIKRAYFEGVIQELISNCIIEKYFSGKISKLGCLLGYKSNEIKECINGEVNLFNVDKWETYNPEERESILCALASSQI